MDILFDTALKVFAMFGEGLGIEKRDILSGEVFGRCKFNTHEFFNGRCLCEFVSFYTFYGFCFV